MKEVRLHPNSSCAFMIQTGSLRGFMPGSRKKKRLKARENVFGKGTIGRNADHFRNDRFFAAGGVRSGNWQIRRDAPRAQGAAFRNTGSEKSADCRRSYLHLILLRLFFSGKAVKGLTTREEKRRLFRQIGIDVLIEFPLTFRLRRFLRRIFCV